MSHRETAERIVGECVCEHGSAAIFNSRSLKDAIASALAQVERETIERCAKVCEERRRIMAVFNTETAHTKPAYVAALDEVENGIRALLPAPEPKETP